MIDEMRMFDQYTSIRLIFMHHAMIRVGLTALIGMMMPGILHAAQQSEDRAAGQNPITKIARFLSPQLVKVEDRLSWLNRQALTLARHRQYDLSYHIGYCGHRPTADGPDPTIVMDLGATMPIERIYLVPSQSEYSGDSGIFPKRLTLECSNHADFRDAETLYESKELILRRNHGVPMVFTSDFSGRYVRLTVHQGSRKGSHDVFGLSEFFVFSNRKPVSFNATITTTGNFITGDIWRVEALNDGRTPLGTWNHGMLTGDVIGDLVEVSSGGQSTSWRIEWPQTQPIDQIILYPYQLERSADASIMPERLQIELITTESAASNTTIKWNNPINGSRQMAPLVFPIGGSAAKALVITATQPWTAGNRHVHALSEIEAWSGGRNITRDIVVTRIHNGEKVGIKSLTDGFSSEKNIAPIDTWLNQLTLRGRIEEEIQALRSIQSQLATRSELNVSWGAAVILGLTFLVPVFIFERRRMRSKEQLDIIRKRIAADLHDDIGSNLGSISLIARTARKELQKADGPTEVDHDLGEMELIARESSLAMRDIVWLLERKQDSIGDLVHRMRETAGRLLRGADFNLQCTSTKTAAKLTLDAKRHLFLFYKEAIHNILKHSQADQISIRFWDEGEQLGMEIIDNGIGLPMNDGGDSVPVKKLEERADVIGGAIKITSSAESGTCIRLLVKRSKLTTPSIAS